MPSVWDKATSGLWSRGRGGSRDIEISEQLHKEGQSSYGMEPPGRSSGKRTWRGLLPGPLAEKWQSWVSANEELRRHEYKYGNIPKNIIHPRNTWYRCWWYCTVILAAFTAWLIPYLIAFGNQAGFYPYDSAGSILLYIITLIFTIDMGINFSLARYVKEELITDRQGIAREYLRLYFWLDLISVIPWSALACILAGRANGPVDTLTGFLNLLKLLYLLQLYRLHHFFGSIRFNLSLSLLLVTLFRNMALILFVQNFFACAFYYVARQHGFSAYSWVGRLDPWFDGASTKSTFDMYVYSMYWSIATLASVGYGGIHPFLVTECVVVILYIMLNIFLIAYVTGTITKVVIRGDEKVGHYRDRMRALNKFDGMHALPKGLREDMSNHLQLQFKHERASDEAVLRGYPSTIRRRVLRHLYLSSLQRVYLFSECRMKFLDAILALSRVDLYLPRVEILTEGDFVNELFTVVSGEMESFSLKSNLFNGLGSGELNVDMLMSGPVGVSRQGQRHSLLTEGDVFGEVAFLTGTTQIEAVKTLTVCRVLVIQRSDFDKVCDAFPDEGRRVLENLLQRAEQLASRVPSSPDFRSPSGLSPVVESHSAGANDEDGKEMMEWAPQPKQPQQRQPSGEQQLQHVKQVVEDHVAQHNEERAGEFLHAALRGDNARLRQMLSQGFDVNIRNFDGRSALMLACSRGLRSTAELLIQAGADVNAVDVSGATPLWEACKSGSTASDNELVQLLRTRGGRVASTPLKAASLLCAAVAEGNLQLLQQLLRSGMEVDAAGPGGCTALHVAAAEGNLGAVRLLVEEGGANVSVMDSWQRTPLDEAQRIQDMPIITYLRSKTTS